MKVIYKPLGAVALTGLDSKGSLWPSAFSAVILKMYSLSSISLLAVNLKVVASTVPDFVQDERFTSLCSMT